MDMFIDGGWRQAASGARHNVVNPATGAVVDTVPTGGKSDADVAIVAAQRAFQTWRRNAGRDARALAEKGREPDARARARAWPHCSHPNSAARSPPQ